MNLRTPELLLLFYILFPMKSPLVAQALLCQIKAIHSSRHAEKLLDLDLDNDTDEAFKEFLVSFWFNSRNASANAYLCLIAPYLGLVNHPIMEIRRKVAKSKFEFSKHALDQSVRDQIQVSEIEAVMTNGHLIEDYSDDQHGYLICGFTQFQRPIHVKCGSAIRPLIKIIAVYEPDPERWSDKFSMRRRDNHE
ncbi:MAG: DUF4258 domain-containing protein [Leptolyngbyaceae cyanobacterium MO_188.B28]|nr:DUF4258 domain-containing protein [Leptolyngbyaceae cyanobacterium MO_188.B28]